MRLISLVLFRLIRALARIHMYTQMPLFGSHGTQFRFDPTGTYTHKNIHVGDQVNLGVEPVMIASMSAIRIGNNVMFGPRVTIVGGGHNTTVVGRPMSSVHEKTGNEDLGVVIEDDVWVGSGAIILRGVTLGRGSIVAAGAVVTKSSPPYSVIGGSPASVLKFRWSIQEIMEHENRLYPPERRLREEDFELWIRSNSMLEPKRNVDLD